MQRPCPPTRESLAELAWLFLRLGATSFGGPAVHVAMMEEEVVRRRKWLSHEEFLDLYGATNLIPGPNSTEMAIHIGHARAGWAGLVVAGACFILPAVVIVTAIAWAYVRYHARPAVSGVLYGLYPVIIAIVAQALWGLGKTALKTPPLRALGAGTFALALVGANELAILLAAGFVALVAERGARGLAAWLPLPMLGAGSASSATAVGLVPLLLVFLKIGAVLFGSGYVLLAFMRGDLVDRLHWLTESQLLDAVAVGQVTPGPLFTTATFVGYTLAGFAGAAVATVGIFAPAFVFVAVSGPLVPRLRKSRAAGAVLDGVNAASLALMAAVALQLGRAAIVDIPTGVLAALGAVLLVRFKWPSLWLVSIGPVIGLVLTIK